MGNKERIVEAALELFNERGASSVTTNHIAAHLSISPGNLYYHFGNKEEIVRALFPAFAEAAAGAIALPEHGEITAQEVGRYHLRGMEALWRYRFLLRDPHDLLSRDAELAEPFRRLQASVVEQFCRLFERLIGQGQMVRPEPADDLPRVATNAYLLWSQWLQFAMISRGRSDPEPDDVAEGALQGFLTFAPYLEPHFAAQVRAVIDARTAGEEAPATPPRRPAAPPDRVAPPRRRRRRGAR